MFFFVLFRKLFVLLFWIIFRKLMQMILKSLTKLVNVRRLALILSTMKRLTLQSLVQCVSDTCIKHIFLHFISLQSWIPKLSVVFCIPCTNTWKCTTGSSLWEIDTLRHHYSPAVSRYREAWCPVSMTSTFLVWLFSSFILILLTIVRFVASLENDLTVRAKTTEMKITDFSSGSYATVFRDEVCLSDTLHYTHPRMYACMHAHVFYTNAKY